MRFTLASGCWTVVTWNRSCVSRCGSYQISWSLFCHLPEIEKFASIKIYQNEHF